MIDTLVRLLPKAENGEWKGDGGKWKGENGEGILESGKYVLVTLHRPSNVDEPGTLREILLALNDIAQEVPVIFPVHPRTRRRMEDGEGGKVEGSNLIILEPLGCLDFLALMKDAALVLTDSGGIQEETTYLGVPCLTARPNTERPVTITRGTNQLVASNCPAIVQAARNVLNYQPEHSNLDRPEFWDGRAAERIVEVLRLQEGAR